MKPSPSKNLISTSGKPYAFTELGDVLYFGLPIDKYYTIDNIRNERPFSGDVDLLELFWTTKIIPIVLEQ
jgi:hypothetical protein